MEEYIAQLLDDINDAIAKQEEVVAGFPPPEGDSFFEEIEKITEEPTSTLEQIIGLERIQFPPPDRLTEDQIHRLCVAIKNLWRVFNFEAVLPNDLPAELTYKLLLEKFEEVQPYARFGTWYLEFCDYNVEKCPLGKQFCQCK